MTYIKQRVSPAPSTMTNRDAPHVALQIEPDTPQTPAARAQANPSRPPAWVHRMRQGLRQGVNVAANNLGGVLVGAGGVEAARNVIGFLSDENLNERSPGLIMGTLGGALLMAMGAAIMSGALRQVHLAYRPLAKVVNDFRAARTNSSSSNRPAFDWSRPGLFINEAGQDVAREVSHYLNRLLDTLQNTAGQNTRENYDSLNAYLDLLEENPEARSVLAYQVQDLNAQCLNRNAAGINTILREIRKNYSDAMPVKDFILSAVLEIALKEADAEVFEHMQEIEEFPTAESYQALQGDVIKALRRHIPELPHQFEDVYQGYDRHSLLTDEERTDLSEKIVSKLTNPMECARLLMNSKKENAFMEKRFADKLAKLEAPLSDDNRTRLYDEFEEEHQREISLEEIQQIDIKLKNERDLAVQNFYAEVIKTHTGLHTPIKIHIVNGELIVTSPPPVIRQMRR